MSTALALRARLVLVTLLALAGMLLAQPRAADAALPFGLPLSPKPQPAPVIPPVVEPIAADPAGAARTGCSGVNRSVAEVGVQGLRGTLRCLARKDADARGGRIGGWQRTSVKLRGEVTAARIWANLRATRSGRRALVAAAKRPIEVTVRPGDRSKVVLRAPR